MSGRNRVFIDTAPIIYFLENDSIYGRIVMQKLQDTIDNKGIIVMSVLGCGEYLTIPYRNNDKLKEANFFKFIKDLDIIVYDINIEIMKQASKLRAKYKWLKMPDAIQLSTALYGKCKQLLTNDKKIRKVSEIDCDLVGEVI